MSSFSKFELFGSAMGKKAAQLPAPAEPDAPDEPKQDPFGLVRDGKANKKLLADPTAPGVKTNKSDTPDFGVSTSRPFFNARGIGDRNNIINEEISYSTPDQAPDPIDPTTGRINVIDNAYNRRVNTIPPYSVKPIYNKETSQNYFATPNARRLGVGSGLESSFFNPLVQGVNDKIDEDVKSFEPALRAREYHTKNTASPTNAMKDIKSLRELYQQKATEHSDKLFPWLRPNQDPESVVTSRNVSNVRRRLFDANVAQGVRDSYPRLDGGVDLSSQGTERGVALNHPVTLGSTDSANGSLDPRTRDLSPPFLTQLNPSQAYAGEADKYTPGKFYPKLKADDSYNKRNTELNNVVSGLRAPFLNLGGASTLNGRQTRMIRDQIEATGKNPPRDLFNNFLGSEFKPSDSSSESTRDRLGDVAVPRDVMGDFRPYASAAEQSLSNITFSNNNHRRLLNYRGLMSALDAARAAGRDTGRIGNPTLEELFPDITNDYSTRFGNMLLNRKEVNGKPVVTPLNNFYDNVLRQVVGAEARPTDPDPSLLNRLNNFSNPVDFMGKGTTDLSSIPITDPEELASRNRMKSEFDKDTIDSHNEIRNILGIQPSNNKFTTADLANQVEDITKRIRRGKNYFPGMDQEIDDNLSPEEQKAQLERISENELAGRLIRARDLSSQALEAARNEEASAAKTNFYHPLLQQPFTQLNAKVSPARYRGDKSPFTLNDNQPGMLDNMIKNTYDWAFKAPPKKIYDSRGNYRGLEQPEVKEEPKKPVDITDLRKSFMDFGSDSTLSTLFNQAVPVRNPNLATFDPAILDIIKGKDSSPPPEKGLSIEEAIRNNPDKLNTFFNSLYNSSVGSMSNRRTPTMIGPGDSLGAGEIIGKHFNPINFQTDNEEIFKGIGGRFNKFKTDKDGKTLPSAINPDVGLTHQQFGEVNAQNENPPLPRDVDPAFKDLYYPSNKHIATANKLIKGDESFQLIGRAQLGDKPTRGNNSPLDRNELANARAGKTEGFLSSIAQILATSNALHEVPGTKPVKLDMLSGLNSKQIADIVKQDNLFGANKTDILSWLSSNSPNARVFLDSLQREDQPTWGEEATLYPSEKEKTVNPLDDDAPKEKPKNQYERDSPYNLGAKKQ